ncbi:MAG TPA: glycosyltransferase family 2 protein [Flavobacteriales bacterium]|jgi:glycosyltransferase involved in cell wall biosynthesis|nr:glycosyltransferase family 2 protein [Flavobacteriales bacterium]
MIKLSIAIITFNEERNIARCLESVKEIADEIVIVDSISTDQTIELAKGYGATIYRQKFLGHIEQKNLALQKCSNDIVLSLDADEALDDELRESIKFIKQNWKGDAYKINRLNNYAGQWIRHGSWYPDKKIRLLDKRKGRWKGINPHDRIELNPAAHIHSLGGNILHFSFGSIHEHIEQINKFTTIQAEAMFKEGRKTSWFDLNVKPGLYFFRDIFIRSGWRDGYYGWVIAKQSANSTYLKYAKLKALCASAS